MCNVNLTLEADILEDHKEPIHQRKDLVFALESMGNKRETQLTNYKVDGSMEKNANPDLWRTVILQKKGDNFEDFPL